MASDHFPVDLQNRALRIVEQGFHFRIERAILGEQLAHVLRAAAGSRLVGLRAHPFHQPGLVERAHAHQHARDRAVAADPVVAALGEAVFDDRHVDGIKNDHGIARHAQRGGSVDPVAVPARCAQFGEDFSGVVAALGGDDDVALFQRINVKRALECFFVLGLSGGSAACVGGGEKDGFDHVEVFFGDHAIDQDRADHAAPAHEAYSVSYFHLLALSVFFSCDLRKATLPGSSVSGEGARRTGLS